MSLDTRSSGSKLIQHFMPFGIIFFLALCLFFFQLDSESLWIDEVLSIRSAEKIFNFKSSRPIYFILLNLWMYFGNSDFWLRSLSILFALISILLIYQLGCRTDSKATGAIAALLLTLSPLFINHAQEVRMYTLGTGLGLAGTLALMQWLQESQPFSLAIWSITRWLMFLTAPLNIALIFTDFLLVGLRILRDRKLLRVFSINALFLGAACIPTFILAAQNSGDVLGMEHYQPRPGLLSLPGILTRFTIWSVKPPFDIAWLSWLTSVYALVLAGMVIVIVFSKPWKSPIGWILLWWFIPLAAVFVVSYLTKSLWVERYLLFTAPYGLILLAAGFTKIWKWKWPIALSICLLYSLMVGSGLYRYYAKTDRADWRGVIQTISRNEQAGDRIAIVSAPTLFEYYYQGSSPTTFLGHLGKNSTLQAIDQNLKGIPTVESRLWLAYERTTLTSGEGHENFSKVVENKFQLEKKQKFYDVDLFLLTPKAKE